MEDDTVTGLEDWDVLGIIFNFVGIIVTLNFILRN